MQFYSFFLTEPAKVVKQSARSGLADMTLPFLASFAENRLKTVFIVREAEKVRNGLRDVLVQNANIGVAVHAVLHFVHDAVDQRHPHAPFFAHANVVLDVGFTVVGPLKRLAVVRQLKDHLLVIIPDGEVQEFLAVFLVGMNDQVGADLIYRQYDLVEGDLR